LHFIHEFTVNWIDPTAVLFGDVVRVAYRSISMAALCVGGRAGLRPLIWLAVTTLLVALVLPAAAGEPIVVLLDQARVVKLPDRAATVVVGNPLIADMTTQPGGIAVITGKGYGATNFIIMDHGGAVLTEKTVEVKGPSDRIVVIFRGVTRETYSCQPSCERRITLGDNPDYFDKTIAETVTRDSQAAVAAAAGRSER
jgi:Flp pilus assembly secretin CpaC